MALRLFIRLKLLTEISCLLTLPDVAVLVNGDPVYMVR
jgi:hypothetical protein